MTRSSTTRGREDAPRAEGADWTKLASRRRCVAGAELPAGIEAASEDAAVGAERNREGLAVYVPALNQGLAVVAKARVEALAIGQDAEHSHPERRGAKQKPTLVVDQEVSHAGAASQATEIEAERARIAKGRIEVTARIIGERSAPEAGTWLDTRGRAPPQRYSWESPSQRC